MIVEKRVKNQFYEFFNDFIYFYFFRIIRNYYQLMTIQKAVTVSTVVISREVMIKVKTFLFLTVLDRNEFPL